MNTFKSQWKFWALAVLTGIYIMAAGYRAIQNGMAENIYFLYMTVISNIIVIGLIIPVTALLIIIETDTSMGSSRMLAFGSRQTWWKALQGRVFWDCLCLVLCILVPSFLIAIFMGKIGTAEEWGYILFLFLTLFLMLYLAAQCIVFLEIRFHQGILSVCVVLLLSFVPNLFAVLFRPFGISIPGIDMLLNLGYALDEGGFYLLRCVVVCIILFLLAVLVRDAGRALIRKQDILWK